MKHRDLILFTNEVPNAIDAVADALQPSSVYVLTDTNTAYFVLPRMADCRTLTNAVKIVCKSGDTNKDIDALKHVWRELADNGANRQSLLINIGGGVVSDLGGFAAATFKRGIRYVNVPTTLLSAVDAAVGGKTGINFMGLKNEIGAFHSPQKVIISNCFFNTLNDEELLSGYAEMLKHALLKSDEVLTKLLGYDILQNNDKATLLEMMSESVKIKKEITDKDPEEKGIRKALNLGHTAGHAFESLAMKRRMPVSHGTAVAHGLVVELILSHIKHGFKIGTLQSVVGFVKANYASLGITCNDYPKLLDLMHHDKKNNDNEINFTLLSAPGKIIIDNKIDETTIKEALDIYQDLIG